MEKSELQYFRSECLASHNCYRAEHGTAPLVWNTSLANAAQHRAEQLLKGETLKVDREVGENIACLWGSELTGHKVSRIWYEAKRYFDFAAPKLTARSRPFCQVLWEGTRELGTGAVTTKDGKHIVVARYHPPADNQKNLVARNVRLHRTAQLAKRISVGTRWSRHFLGLKQFQEECLLTHNEYRLRHGAAALHWSQSLAWEAQCWAEHLARMGDLKHNEDETVGENLAGMLGDELSGKEATDIWYDEIEDYEFDRPGYGEDTSNFTQLVWGATEFLGVGRATEGDLCVVVAFYEPPGNVEGSFSQNVLRFGSPARRRRTREPKGFIPPIPDLDGFRLECLVAHNYYRARHGSPPLVLSASLTDEAQYWAERLLVTRTFEDHDSSRMGLNILLLNQRNVSGIKVSEVWYSEVSQYDFDSPGFDARCRRFTQLAWYGSRKLGIGKASDQDGTTVVVARYEPVGNMDGLFVPNVNMRGYDRGSFEPPMFQVHGQDNEVRNNFVGRDSDDRQVRRKVVPDLSRSSEVDENANVVPRTNSSPPTDYFNQLVWIDSTPSPAMDAQAPQEEQQDAVEFVTEEYEYCEEGAELDEAEVFSDDEIEEHVQDIRRSLSLDSEGTEPDTHKGGVLARVAFFEHFQQEDNYRRPQSTESQEIVEDNYEREGYSSAEEREGEEAGCELEFEDVFLTHHEDEDSLGRVSDDIPLSEEREYESDVDEASALAEFLLDNAETVNDDTEQQEEDEEIAPRESELSPRSEPPDQIVFTMLDHKMEQEKIMEDIRVKFDFVPVKTNSPATPKEIDWGIFYFDAAPPNSPKCRPHKKPCDEVVYADVRDRNVEAEIDLEEMFKRLEGQITKEGENENFQSYSVDTSVERLDVSPEQMYEEELDEHVRMVYRDYEKETNDWMEDKSTEINFLSVTRETRTSPSDVELASLFETPLQEASEIPTYSGTACDEQIEAVTNKPALEQSEPFELWELLESLSDTKTYNQERGKLLHSTVTHQTESAKVVKRVGRTIHFVQAQIAPEESSSSLETVETEVKASVESTKEIYQISEDKNIKESSTAIVYKEERASSAQNASFVREMPVHFADEAHSIKAEMFRVPQEPGAVPQTLQRYRELSANETETPELIQDSSYHISGELRQGSSYETESIRQEDNAEFPVGLVHRYCEGEKSFCQTSSPLFASPLFIAEECSSTSIDNHAFEEEEQSELHVVHNLEEGASVVEMGIYKDNPTHLSGEGFNSEGTVYILEEEQDTLTQNALEYDDEEISTREQEVQISSPVHVVGEIFNCVIQEKSQMEDINQFYQAEDITDELVCVMDRKRIIGMTISPMHTASEITVSCAMDRVHDTEFVEIDRGQHWEENSVSVTHEDSNGPAITLAVAGEVFNDESPEITTEEEDPDTRESAEEYEERKPQVSQCDLYSPRSLVYIAAEVLTQSTPEQATGSPIESISQSVQVEEAQWEEHITDEEYPSSAKFTEEFEDVNATCSEGISLEKDDFFHVAGELTGDAFQEEEEKDSGHELYNAQMYTEPELKAGGNVPMAVASSVCLITEPPSQTAASVTRGELETETATQYGETNGVSAREVYKALIVSTPVAVVENLKTHPGNVSVQSEAISHTHRANQECKEAEAKLEDSSNGLESEVDSHFHFPKISDVTHEMNENSSLKQKFVSHDSELDFEQEEERKNRTQENVVPELFEVEVGVVPIRSHFVTEKVKVETRRRYAEKKEEMMECSTSASSDSVEDISPAYTSDYIMEKLREDEDMCVGQHTNAGEEFQEEIDVMRVDEALTETEFRGEPPHVLRSDTGVVEANVQTVKIEQSKELPSLARYDLSNYEEEVEIEEGKTIEEEVERDVDEDFQDSDKVPQETKSFGEIYEEEVEVLRAKKEKQTVCVKDLPRKESPSFDPCSLEFESALEDFGGEYVEEIDIGTMPDEQQDQAQAGPIRDISLQPRVYEEEVEISASKEQYEKELDMCDYKDSPATEGEREYAQGEGTTASRQLGIYGDSEGDMPRYYVDISLDYPQLEEVRAEAYYPDVYVRQGEPLEEDMEEFILVKYGDDYLPDEEEEEGCDHRTIYVIQEEDNNMDDEYESPKAYGQRSHEFESSIDPHQDQCPEDFGLEEIRESPEYEMGEMDREFRDDDLDDDEERQLAEYERLESFVILEEKLSQVESDEDFEMEEEVPAESDSSQETLQDDEELNVTMTRTELHELKTGEEKLEPQEEKNASEGENGDEGSTEGVSKEGYRGPQDMCRVNREFLCDDKQDTQESEDLSGELTKRAEAEPEESTAKHSDTLTYEVKSQALQQAPPKHSESSWEEKECSDIIKRRALQNETSSYSSGQSSDSAVSSEESLSPTPMDELNGLTEFQFECLKEHNRRRRQHRAKTLAWSAMLAESAREWAEYLAASNILMHSNEKETGENLACASGMEVTGSLVTDIWYDEVKEFNFDIPAYNAKCGHFTQLVWGGSREMGVAKAVSSNGTQYIVARYRPPGNILGAFRENVKPGNGFSSRPRRRKSSTRRRTSYQGTPADSLTDRERFKTECLAPHNYYRSLHGSPALHWSPLLAAEAQNWAEKLAKTGSYQRSAHRDRGESVAYKWGEEMSTRQAVELWYDEVYEYDFSCPGFASNTGHFSQLVWASTQELGMGEALAEDGTRVIVARYLPPGNLVGQFQQNVQPRCRGTVQP